MSEHSSSLLIESGAGKQPIKLLKTLGFKNPRFHRKLDWEDASSLHLDGVAVACSNKWTCVYNYPDMFGSGDLPDLDDPPYESIWLNSVEQALLEISRPSQVFGWILEGSTGTCAYTWHVRGKRRRIFLHLHRKIIYNEGTPIAIETELDEMPLSAEPTVFKFQRYICDEIDALADSSYDAFIYDSCPL